jgi:hypothetical protein
MNAQNVNPELPYFLADADAVLNAHRSCKALSPIFLNRSVRVEKAIMEGYTGITLYGIKLTVDAYRAGGKATLNGCTVQLTNEDLAHTVVDCNSRNA